MTVLIVQAHQKDAQVWTILSSKVGDVIQSFKGQFFANAHPQEISIAVKFLYLALTTLRGNRTLGEEYVDLIYVNRKGNKLVQRYKKLLFIVSYALGPYMASKWLQKWDENGENETRSKQYSLKRLLNMALNLHLVVFYFKGAYYDIIKRIFGLRYAVGHKVDGNEAKFRKSSSNSYKLLGYILLLQSTSRGVPIVIRYLKSLALYDGKNSANKHSVGYDDEKAKNGIIQGIPDESQVVHIDLADESRLNFIPKASRTCVLCLNAMMDPSCAPCGHLFCWNCILNWCKERAECPLCRRACQGQQVLSLR